MVPSATWLGNLINDIVKIIFTREKKSSIRVYRILVLREHTKKRSSVL